ncbi:MAG: class I SAM-dependent methyltransferase [Actinomycetota bacterium]|nr:class I SAM-dependent methyltransferase [Actinomycetota bacterium]
MSENEREHWDQRYAAGGARSTEPATFLREVAPLLPPGSRLLDVGGGSGRNAIWLAKQGHEVTIADISETGLAIARTTAEAARVTVATVCEDLNGSSLPEGPWDVIVDFHFMKRDLFPIFREVLRPGGLLVFCQATVRNLERHERPPRPYLLAEGEGWDLLEGFELLIAREGWSAEDRHEFETLARVPLVVG